MLNSKFCLRCSRIVSLYHIVLTSFISVLIGCNPVVTDIIVNTSDELEKAISNAKPGDNIVLTNGTWTDVRIRFTGNGTETKPIRLSAETPGKVFIEGESDLKFGGEYLIASGLYFRNGYTPSNSVVEFRINDDTIANHCILTNSVIENYNQLSRDRADRWVQFWGRYNQLDHCYLTGKSNRGPTVRVDIRGNESIKNYHQIVFNHFGYRPPKGGPSAETIQLGNSFTSMSPSNTMVANNLFERCNGEVEVISSKTNFNEFRNNVFYKSEGSLVTRHGNYCIVDGNYFIGDDNSENIGGIRIIGTGHWITNNYFYNLRGKNFRSPLAVMNGIPRSPLNRYIQVTDVVIAHNSWINCVSPWQFGVGSNVSQKDVLPPSEIRSARPVRTTVANNIIYNQSGDSNPLVEHDEIDGINFKNNIISNQGVEFKPIDGLNTTSLEMAATNDMIFVPKTDLNDFELFAGFEFETIIKDLFGNSRSEFNTIGAITKSLPGNAETFDLSTYGTDWHSGKKTDSKQETFEVTPDSGDLSTKLQNAKSGDLLELLPGDYDIETPLAINKEITIRSKNSNDPARLIYSGEALSPAFELHPGGNLSLENTTLTGQNSQFAFASLKENMSQLYTLKVSGCEISNFAYVLKAFKQSFSDSITFVDTTVRNCQNGIELSAETNDRGDYNAEYLTVSDCRFENIAQNVIDYYRGGYDESTVGGTLSVTNSEFIGSGRQEANGILLNTYGIINVDISNNTFKNNQVELVALLWGAKNNTHSGNQLINSGKIVTEENLKLKLVY